MTEPSIPFEPLRVRVAAAVVRALPAGRYYVINLIARAHAGTFWWRLPQDVGGLIFRCDLRDMLMREVCMTGRYEPQETILLRHLVRPGGVFVDVGANWGYFTLVGAGLAGSSGRVVCVEADPRACRALAINLARNDLGLVTVVEAAVSDREGTISLAAYGEDSDEHSNYGLVGASAGGPGARRFDVRTRALDDILDDAGVDRVDLLKMDVEGSEGRALAGLSRRLAKGAVERLLLELHPALLRERGESATAIVNDLRCRGFHAWGIDHTPEMHRRAAAGAVPVASLLRPLNGGEDLGEWPHVLLTRSPSAMGDA